MGGLTDYCKKEPSHKYCEGTKDTDGDGVGNNGDAFPEDPKETADQDGDGVGDNADTEETPATTPPPADPNDSDGDGVPNDQDAFPTDPKEGIDSDGDGHGDNSDAHPH